MSRLLPEPAVALQFVNPSSSGSTLDDAKGICLEAFGHWGAVPSRKKDEGGCCDYEGGWDGAALRPALPAAYVAIHNVHGVCGFACIKRHNQPSAHPPQNNGVIHTVCVSGNLRGGGIGTRFVKLLIEEARVTHELDYLILAAQKGPNQPRLVKLYSRCGFVKMEGEEISNMGTKLAGKISEDGVSKLAAFLSSRQEKDGGGAGNVWMKLRLRNRCVESKRKVPISDSEFPLPDPPPPSPFEFVRNRELLIEFEPQVGPSCGLTSLYMIRDALGLDEDDCADLLSLARERGYTKDGEMFSSQDFAQFCSSVLPCCDITLHQTFPSAEALSSSLSCLSSVFLVPFDIIGNSIGCRNGNSSHWGIITSCLQPLDDCSEFPFYFYVQHSQSRVPIISEYSQLLKSNLQLEETNAKFAGKNELRNTAIEIRRLQS